MKPPAFDYHRPGSVEEALSLLAALGEDARVLAGGQSLIPVLNFRLAAPTALVDLGDVRELSFIEGASDGGSRIGAMTRQRDAETSPVVSERAPLLALALPWIAHVAIRNRGTIGGSLAHADPAAELPAVMLALGASLTVLGPDGSRRVDAESFFPGFFSTALQPAEILTEIHVPPRPPGTGFAFQEIARRRGDFALAGAAAQVTVDEGDRISRVRLGLLGVGTGPVLSPTAQAMLGGVGAGAAPLSEVARAVASDDVSPLEDVHASAAYRRHLVRILTERVLRIALDEARTDEARTA